MEVTGTVESIEFDGSVYTFHISRDQIVYASANLFGTIFNRPPKPGQFVIFQVDSRTHYAFSCDVRG